MTQTILGGLMLSIIHASIPNHWISLVVLGKVEKWSSYEAKRITVVAGLSYTLSTTIVGILTGLLSFKLNAVCNIAGYIYLPVVLVVLGLSYICFGYSNNRTNINKKYCLRKHKRYTANKIEVMNKKPNSALIVSISSAMIFSPCTEIGIYYSNAGTYGLICVVLLSFIYIFVTIAGMIILVDLGSKGIRKLSEKFLFIEHHERVITGIILILMGIESYFIKF